MIKFTVVTITYNAAKVLAPTLRSVASQTWQHVEHWIIDGASKDNTLEIARKYAADNNRYDVHILSEPDGGIYFAMNKGLERATGDYIIFLNAGDRFANPETLEQVAAKAEAYIELPAVVYGDTDIVDEEGHFLGHRHLNAPERLTWHSFLHGMTVCHQAFYVRTDIARGIRYDTSLRHSADVDWCIRVMKEGQRRHLENANVHEVVALFLAGGDTTQSHRDSLKERFRVMRHHYGLFPTVVMHVWFLIRAALRKLN